MAKIEIVNIDKKKKYNEIDYDKILKYLTFIFLIFGVLCLFAQLVYFGKYDLYEDSTLFICGLLVIILGLQINNLRE